MRDKARKLREQIVDRLDELTNLIKANSPEHNGLSNFQRAVIVLVVDDKVDVLQVAEAIAAGVIEGHQRIHPSPPPPPGSPHKKAITEKDITWALMIISQILQMYQNISG